MKTKRVSLAEAFGGGIIKSSRGFIEGTTIDGELSPIYITVSDEDAYQLFLHSEWLFATVDRIVNDCVKVPISIQPKEKSASKSGRLKARMKIVERFFENPNDNKESFDDLREKLIRDMLVYGRGALEKVKLNGRLQEIYTVIAKNVKLCPDASGNLPMLKAYKLKDTKTNKNVYFAKDELVFMVDTPISGSMYGLKKIDVLANVVATDLLREAHNGSNFTNGAEASGILGIPGLSRTELKKFRQFWETNHKGAENAHRLAIVTSKDVNFVRMALTNKDMEFTEYGKEIRNKVFATYGMQPFVMGVVDDTTGKLNSSEQIRAYKDGALRPILRREARAYTKEIIEDGFGFDDIVIKFSGIDLEDLKTEADVADVELKNGTITINENRNRKGMDPVPWGDTPLTMAPGGGQVDPDTGKVIPPSQQTPAGGAAPAKPANKPAKKPVKPAGKAAAVTALMHFFTDYKRAVMQNNVVEEEYIFNAAAVDERFDDDTKRLLACAVHLVKKLKKLNTISKEPSCVLSSEIDKVFKQIVASNSYWKLFAE